MSALHTIARTLGRTLRPVRPGVDALTSSKLSRKSRIRSSIEVTSAGFTEGDAIPRQCGVDGRGVFPGVAWEGIPEGTKSLVLLVEDADIPLPVPVTHLIVYAISPEVTRIEAGAVQAFMAGPSPEGWLVGRNFMGARGWTPPAPPPGHGAHRYAFQVFALDRAPQFRYPPHRGRLMREIEPHILAQGRLIGTYKRV